MAWAIAAAAIASMHEASVGRQRSRCRCVSTCSECGYMGWLPLGRYSRQSIPSGRWTPSRKGTVPRPLSSDPNTKKEAPGGAPQGLQQAGFREGKGRSFTDDEMVQNTIVHQFENRFQSGRDCLVGMARLGHARGVIVGKDDRAAIVLIARLRTARDTHWRHRWCRGTSARKRSRGVASRETRRQRLPVLRWRVSAIDILARWPGWLARHRVEETFLQHADGLPD